jgi:hypothetical protein
MMNAAITCAARLFVRHHSNSGLARFVEDCINDDRPFVDLHHILRAQGAR